MHSPKVKAIMAGARRADQQRTEHDVEHKRLLTVAGEAFAKLAPIEAQLAKIKQEHGYAMHYRNSGAPAPAFSAQEKADEYALVKAELDNAKQAHKKARESLGLFQQRVRLFAGGSDRVQDIFRVLYEELKVDRAADLREEVLATFAVYQGGHPQATFSSFTRDFFSFELVESGHVGRLFQSEVHSRICTVRAALEAEIAQGPAGSVPLPPGGDQ